MGASLLWRQWGPLCRLGMSQVVHGSHRWHRPVPAHGRFLWGSIKAICGFARSKMPAEQMCRESPTYGVSFPCEEGSDQVLSSREARHSACLQQGGFCKVKDSQ